MKKLIEQMEKSIIKIEQLYFTFVIFKSSSPERMLCLFVSERLPSDFHARTS